MTTCVVGGLSQKPQRAETSRGRDGGDDSQQRGSEKMATVGNIL
jgi:hypothetical protein